MLPVNSNPLVKLPLTSLAICVELDTVPDKPVLSNPEASAEIVVATNLPKLADTGKKLNNWQI